MRTGKAWAVGLATAILTCAATRAQGEPTPEEEWRAAAERAATNGIEWLRAMQQPTGAWSNTNFPALTALPLWAFLRSGNKELDPNIRRAVAFIAANAHETGVYRGAIFRPVPGQKSGGYINYNTAISMLVLHKTGDPSLAPLVLNAREFLARSQYMGDSLHYGGMGYDSATQRDYADLSNSYVAYEAMRLTHDVEERRGARMMDLNWKAALRFIQRCHNHPKFNDQGWASPDPGEKGGFAYMPDNYRPDFGAYKDANGVLRYRSAPGMTYAGLLSYLYAGVERSDPRVLAAVAWIGETWNPDKSNRNPELAGQPEEKGGLYYMYYVMARALAAYGEDELERPDGTRIRWREELTSRLVARQREDGHWTNEYGRYWESDPTLVTAYAVLALQSALGR